MYRCCQIISQLRTTRLSLPEHSLLPRRSSVGGQRTARRISRARSRTRAILWLAMPSQTLLLALSPILLVTKTLVILVKLCSHFCDADYLTANDPTLTTPLTDDERADLYGQLASGAESGWDYSTRFIKDPVAGGSNNTNPALRSLNIKSNIPVDLNSILCMCYVPESMLCPAKRFTRRCSQHYGRLLHLSGQQLGCRQTQV